MAKTKASARAHRAAEPQAQSEEVAVEEVEDGIIVDQAMFRHVLNRLKIFEDKVAEGFAERGRSKKRKKPQKKAPNPSGSCEAATQCTRCQLPKTNNPGRWYLNKAGKAYSAVCKKCKRLDALSRKKNRAAERDGSAKGSELVNRDDVDCGPSSGWRHANICRGAQPVKKLEPTVCGTRKPMGCLTVMLSLSRWVRWMQAPVLTLTQGFTDMPTQIYLAFWISLVKLLDW